MIKLTREEFEKKYGTEATSALKENKKSAFGRVSSTIGDTLQDVKGAITGTGQFKGQSPVRRGFEATASAFNTIPKLAIDVAPEPVRAGVEKVSDVVGSGFEKLTGAIGDNKKLQDWTINHPEAFSALEEVLGTTSSAGQIAGDILAVSGGVKTVQGGVAKVKQVAPKIKGAADDIVTLAKDKLPVKSKLTLEQEAIKDATPSYESLSKKGKGKVLSQVEEGGVFKGRTVKSDKLQTEAGIELSKVKDYNPKATQLEKYQVANKEVVNQAKSLVKALEKEKAIVPKREVTAQVKTAIDEVQKNSLLLQKTDPAIKNYKRVYNNAIKTVPGNLGGIFQLRKLLDDAYKNAKGANAFSDKIGALDEINRAVRDALTEYVIKNAKNTKVKASMKSQWDLYRALDELEISAAAEGGSKFKRFKQKNPVINKAIEKGAGGVGLGTALNILN